MHGRTFPLVALGRASGPATAAEAADLAADARTFGRAWVIMTDGAPYRLDPSDAREIASGSSRGVVDEELATKTSSSRLSRYVCAGGFNQTGWMAGCGVEGSKFARIDP